MSDPEVTTRDVATSVGWVHVASAGTGPATPVVCLHQTPRSWDEYREVLGLLGATRAVHAVDTPGHGGSAPPVGHTIEAYADGVVAAIDALGLATVDLVGHHTGGVVAVEVAARDPARVRRLVLSSTAFVDAAERRARAARTHTIDDAASRDDGAHLLELWRARAAFYPVGRPRLLERFLADWLRADEPAAGHRAVARYEMEHRLPLLRGTPTLCVGHAQDPHAMPSLAPLAEVLDARVAVIEDGHVPLEHTAAAFVDVVRPFLDP